MLAGGLAGSTVLDRKGASMLAGEFAPGFRIDLHHKDMGIVLEAARAKGVTIPLGAVTAQLMQRCAPRATVVSTTRPCCVASNGSRARK